MEEKELKSILKKLTVFDLLEELSERTQWEINYGILLLLIQGKIDYKTVSERYVDYLEHKNDDFLEKLIDCETCILEGFHNTTHDNEKNRPHINRSLYILNQSKRFQMNKLNEKYNYNEDEAKECSSYWRYKEGNKGFTNLSKRKKIEF